MRGEAFSAFRQYTQGASAIQSEQYKNGFEARCWTPTADRLASPAFDQVPAVRAELGENHGTLMGAWLDADRRMPGDPAVARVAASMAALEAAHRRWKNTHVTVATRMLGEARGSGDTSGVSYLRAWMDHRLFGDAPRPARAKMAILALRSRRPGTPPRCPSVSRSRGPRASSP